MSQYLNSNPLAEHNAGIALSSKDIPVAQGGATGNMYQGQGGRAFVQGGGGMSQFHSFDGGNTDTAYARGSYAPVTVGYNSVTKGGRRRRSVRKGHKKCGCDIVTGVGGSRRHRHSRKCHLRNCRSRNCRSRYCRSRKVLRRSRSNRKSQRGGSFANAAYSIAGPDSGVTPSTTALANPAPYTAYNSCHPVSSQ